MRRPSLVELATLKRRLEVDLRVELHLARIAIGRSRAEGTLCSWRPACIDCAHVGVVEHVKGLCAQLPAGPFANGEALFDACVEGDFLGIAQAANRSRAEVSPGWVCEIRK